MITPQQQTEDNNQGESIQFHVISQRGDDFHINPQSRTLKEVIAAITTQLPDVQELSVRGGADQELVTAENETTLQSPLVIEYALSGGGVMVPDAVTSFLDLPLQLQWSLPTPLRVHVCGQDVAVVPPSLPSGSGGGGAFLPSCLGTDLRWPCCYQTLDFSQSPQLQCFCCSLLPCDFVTALPVSRVLSPSLCVTIP
jgi:hypothetical protein